MRIRDIALLLAVPLGLSIPSIYTLEYAHFVGSGPESAFTRARNQKGMPAPEDTGFEGHMRKLMWGELQKEGERYCQYMQEGAPKPPVGPRRNPRGKRGALEVPPEPDYSMAINSLKEREYGPRPNGTLIYCHYLPLGVSKDNSQAIMQFSLALKDNAGIPFLLRRKVAFESHTRLREYVYGSGEREVKILPIWVLSRRFKFGIASEEKREFEPPADNRNWWQKHLDPKAFNEVQAPPAKFLRRSVPVARTPLRHMNRARRI